MDNEINVYLKKIYFFNSWKNLWLSRMYDPTTNLPTAYTTLLPTTPTTLLHTFLLHILPYHTDTLSDDLITLLTTLTTLLSTFLLLLLPYYRTSYCSDYPTVDLPISFTSLLQTFLLPCSAVQSSGQQATLSRQFSLYNRVSVHGK